MFTIKANPTFDATVKIPVPGGQTADLALTFKHMTRDKVKEFFDRAASSEETDGSLLSEIIAGWTGVDAEFSEEALDELCQNYHGAIPAIFDCYLAELSKARSKN